MNVHSMGECHTINKNDEIDNRIECLRRKNGILQGAAA